MLDEVFKQRLAALDTACVCDADKNLRVMDPGIRPLRPGLQAIGRAHTVSCKDDFLTVVKALRDAQPGDVLVIDTRGSRCAVAGELFAGEAARKGLAGIVIDGACRDSAKIKTLAIPVYARFTTPMAGTTTKLFETRIPVTCGGVRVDPGDILFGDDDGIVVAGPNEWKTVINTAEEIQRKEATVLARMEQGASLLELTNFQEHYDAIAAGRDSGFKLTV